MTRFIFLAAFVLFAPYAASAQSIDIENTGSYDTRMGGPDQKLGRSALDDLSDANRIRRDGGNSDRIDNNGSDPTDDFIRYNRAQSRRMNDE